MFRNSTLCVLFWILQNTHFPEWQFNCQGTVKVEVPLSRELKRSDTKRE
jgi:hypothetical protein